MGRTDDTISGENLLMANRQHARVTSLDVIRCLKCKYNIKFNQIRPT